MSMFNERLIHLCDCTCLNEMCMLKHLLIKHEKIFKCFNCFWKVFCFTRSQKFLKLCSPVLLTCFAGQSSCMPLVVSLHKGFSWLELLLACDSRKFLGKLTTWAMKTRDSWGSRQKAELKKFCENFQNKTLSKNN